jgi:DNA-binding GntR family transcriptional regulator
LEKQAVKVSKLLELEILAGNLEPGEKLDEVKLAKRFDVSRTPIREAIAELAANGLVETRPRRSAIVATFSIQQIFDMYEVLAVLEGLCAGLSARRMSEEERETLENLHLKMADLVDTNDWPKYYLMDLKFHQLIYAGSHNTFLEQEALSIRNRMMPYRRVYMEEPNQISIPYQEHTRIVEMILGRESDAAEVSFKEHSSIRADGISDFISALNRKFPDLASKT